MQIRRLISLIFCLALFVFLGAGDAHALVTTYDPVAAGAGKPEVHIAADGTIRLRGARVDQVVGTTFFVTLRWGDLPMRFIMKTDEKTRVTKRYGGTTEAAQVKLGDYLDAEGEFFVGSDTFGLTARAVKDWSLQEESETYSGKIVEIIADGAFTLQTPRTLITLRIPENASIKKGTVAIPLGRVMKGDSVALADGIFDYASNTLTATSVVIFQSRAEFLPRNFQGTLKSINSTSFPAALVVTVDGADYTANVTAATTLQSKNRKPILLARFVSGDVVRFFGALRESEKTLRDERIVDVEVLRNLNL